MEIYSGLSIHTVLDIPGRLIQLRLSFDQWRQKTQCVSEFTVSKLGSCGYWKCFKTTHCVSYSTNIDIVMIYHFTIADIRQYVLANFFFLSWVIFSIVNCLNKQTVLDIPRRLIQVCFINWTVKIADTMY